MYMLSPLPRHRDGGHYVAHSPSPINLPRMGERVGLCNDLFEDCSAFTRVTACTLAGSSKMIHYIRGFSYFVTSITAPIASGRSKIAGWDSHPLENAAFARRTPIVAVHAQQFVPTLSARTGSSAPNENAPEEAVITYQLSCSDTQS